MDSKGKTTIVYKSAVILSGMKYKKTCCNKSIIAPY
jgi:hypothetical protein